MLSLSDFYQDYKNSSDKNSLNNQKLALLQNFRRYLFDKGFIDKKGLQFSGMDLLVNDQNLKNFHYRLLDFFLYHVKNEDIGNKEPFLSIQIYFYLQNRGKIYYEEKLIKKSSSTIAKTRTPSDFIENKHDYTFDQRIRWLNDILDVRHRENRDSMRLQNKFFRTTKNTKQNSNSKQLINKINRRIDGQTNLEKAIVIDGYSARSVIIALNKTMDRLIQKLSSPNIFNGSPIYFKIGSTMIRWLPANNHGKVFLEMNYLDSTTKIKIDTKKSSNQLKETLHKFPYEKELTQLLFSLEEKLSMSQHKNLMAKIREKFSGNLQAFTMHDFNGATPEEVHFLNAFSFLIQIVEVARYLKTGTVQNREIEGEPISIALAISKILKEMNQLTWEETYSNAPDQFKNGKNSYAYSKKDKKYNILDPSSFGGLDSVSGKGLGGNYSLVNSKVQELSQRMPYYISDIQSARTVHRLLNDTYGSGNESDSDNDSVVSLSTENYLYPKKYKDQLRNLIKNIKFSLEDNFNSSIAKELPSLHNLALSNGCLAVDAGGGGDCFFLAVIHQLNYLGINHENHDHATLRSGALDYVLNNWDSFSDFIHNPDEFVMRMSLTGEWADHEIILATALRLGINIRIHRNDGGQATFIQAPNANHEINLGYYVGLHYVSFITRKPELISLSTSLNNFFRSPEYLSKHRHDSQEAQQNYDRLFCLVVI